MLNAMFGIGPIDLPPSLNPLFERPPVRSADDLWLLEQEVYKSSAVLGDRMIALEIRKAHRDTAFVDYAVQTAKDTSPCPLVVSVHRVDRISPGEKVEANLGRRSP